MATTYKSIIYSDIDTAVAMMKDFYAIDDYPVDVEISKTLFREFLADEKLGKAWLIYSDNEIVGYVILTFVFNFEYKGRIAFIDELYIVNNARGKGIGNNAVEFVKTEASKLSLKLLYLEVEGHNENAQKLYLATGFEVHSRKIMKFKIT